MNGTIKLKKKFAKKKSRKTKGGTVYTQQFKTDLQTLDGYLRSLTEFAKKNPCPDNSENDCKLIKPSNDNSTKKPSKSEQVIIICNRENKVLKGPPFGLIDYKAVFNLEFSDQDNACIKMNSSTMNLLIQSVIKDLFDVDNLNFSDIEHYDYICSSQEGIFKKSPYFLVGPKYHYCPQPKEGCYESSDQESIDTILTDFEGENEEEDEVENEGEEGEENEGEDGVENEGEEGEENEGEDGVENEGEEGEENEGEDSEDVCPPSIVNGKNGGYRTLDSYLKGLKDDPNYKSSLPIIKNQIIEPIFQKLDNLFINIQFHHVDPKAHQIFLDGECNNLRPILGDLDKVTFTLNINEKPYRMRTIRNRNYIKNKINFVGEKHGFLNKITQMRYECFPEKNNNIEKLGFLASICVLAPHDIAEDIRIFGLNLIYKEKPIDVPPSPEQLSILINQPEESDYPTLKKFEKDWRSGLSERKIQTKEDSLGFSFEFVKINNNSNIEKNKNLHSVVSLRKKVDKEKDGIIIYDLNTDIKKISIPTYSTPIELTSIPLPSSEDTSDDRSEDLRYVLWIRHCEACHNVASGIAPYREQPLCTEKGIAEAFTFGKNFYKINKIIKEILKITGSEKKYDLYCSVLARAMETSKIMSIGMNSFIESSDKITRINGIQEVDKDFFSGPNIITKEVSNDSCKFLNKNIKEGLEIECSKIINDTTKKLTDKFQISNSKDLEKNYLEFKDNLFSDNFKPENIICIVSHSAYIKDIMKLPYRLNNLDAVFCVYKRNDDGFIIEKEKYLILLEDLINSSDKLYYDLNDEKNQPPILKSTYDKKIRYGNKKIDKEDLKDGNIYANTLFTTCEKFKNCTYTTNELYENSCEHDEQILEKLKKEEEELLNLGIANVPFGGKKNKKTTYKKIKKKNKKLSKKKFLKIKNKKTKKGRKKNNTKKNK